MWMTHQDTWLQKNILEKKLPQKFILTEVVTAVVYIYFFCSTISHFKSLSPLIKETNSDLITQLPPLSFEVLEFSMRRPAVKKKQDDHERAEKKM